MNAEQATKVILSAYNTEKTFPMVESEAKICFIVDRYANKREIMEAVEVLYEKKPIAVNTARTVRGKKALVKFKSPDEARELATDMGML